MLADGIYFNLPPEVHREDPALGSTDHKALLANAVQWQAKRQRQKMIDLGLLEDITQEEQDERERKAAVGKAFGNAVHVMTFDGPAVFEERYAVKPDQPDNVLFTKEQYRAALGSRCRLPGNAKVYDFEQEWLSRVPDPERDDFRTEAEWLVEVAEFMAGREEISKRWMAQISMIDRLMDMKRSDHADLSLRERYLTRGYPEVTVIWTDHRGVRCKARFDYLRIKNIIDGKTYFAREGKEAMECFFDAVEKFAYDLQMVHYLEAREQIARLVAEGAVFGDVDVAWVEKLAACPMDQVTWGWLTIQTMGFPELDYVEPDLGALVFAAAQTQLNIARDRYVAYRDEFGDDEFWIAKRGIVIADELSFPARMANRGAERWRTA